MYSVYKNGILIRRGEIDLYVFINDENEVLSKSFDNDPALSGSVTVVNEETYSSIQCKNTEGIEFYHKLKDGCVGKIIDDYEKVYNIDFIKKKRCDEIDAKTDVLIERGFDFGGEKFSTSSEAQRNWIAIYSAKDYITYPFSVTTKDDKEYSFYDPRIVTVFFMTGVAYVNTNIATGRVFKIAVTNASTKEEIDAIIDNR